MPRLALRSMRFTTVAAWLLLAVTAVTAAVPPGYRYIGSRSVSAGRVVLWYWNVDYFEPGGSPVAFTARLYARAVDVNQERPYVAIVRCDNRMYRGIDDPGPFQPIDPGEPIHAVWRVGCAGGVAVDVAQRHARLSGQGGAATSESGTAATASPAMLAATPAAAAQAAVGPAGTSPASASPATTRATVAAVAAPVAPVATPPTAPPRDAPAPAASEDPRRADTCVRFSEARASPAGDGTITNTCGFAIEVALCYKGGGGGRFDCATPPRGRLLDSLAPGVTHVLPEYRKARHRGIAASACRGGPGTVLPRLDDGRGSCA